MVDNKYDQAHVEELESGRSLSVGVDARHKPGSVQLLDSHQGVVLVPTPSRDPKGE